MGLRRVRSVRRWRSRSASSGCTASKPAPQSRTRFAEGARAQRVHARRTHARAPPDPRSVGRPPALGTTRRRLQCGIDRPNGRAEELFRAACASTRGRFRHRDFRNLWIGQAISTVGGAIGTVAVPYQVYKLTGSTALVGLLGLASLVPLLVVPLVGGAIADAVDRRERAPSHRDRDGGRSPRCSC